MSDSFTERMDYYNSTRCPIRDKHCQHCVESLDGKRWNCAIEKPGVPTNSESTKKCPIPDADFKEYSFSEVPSVVS